MVVVVVVVVKTLKEEYLNVCRRLDLEIIEGEYTLMINKTKP